MSVPVKSSTGRLIPELGSGLCSHMSSRLCLPCPATSLTNKVPIYSLPSRKATSFIASPFATEFSVNEVNVKRNLAIKNRRRHVVAISFKDNIRAHDNYATDTTYDPTISAANANPNFHNLGKPYPEEGYYDDIAHINAQGAAKMLVPEHSFQTDRHPQMSIPFPRIDPIDAEPTREAVNVTQNIQTYWNAMTDAADMNPLDDYITEPPVKIHNLPEPVYYTGQFLVDPDHPKRLAYITHNKEIPFFMRNPVRYDSGNNAHDGRLMYRGLPTELAHRLHVADSLFEVRVLNIAKLDSVPVAQAILNARHLFNDGNVHAALAEGLAANFARIEAIHNTVSHPNYSFYMEEAISYTKASPARAWSLMPCAEGLQDLLRASLGPFYDSLKDVQVRELVESMTLVDTQLGTNWLFHVVDAIHTSTAGEQTKHLAHDGPLSQAAMLPSTAAHLTPEGMDASMRNLLWQHNGSVIGNDQKNTGDLGYTFDAATNIELMVELLTLLERVPYASLPHTTDTVTANLHHYAPPSPSLFSHSSIYTAHEEAVAGLEIHDPQSIFSYQNVNRLLRHNDPQAPASINVSGLERGVWPPVAPMCAPTPLSHDWVVSRTWVVLWSMFLGPAAQHSEKVVEKAIRVFCNRGDHLSALKAINLFRHVRTTVHLPNQHKNVDTGASTDPTLAGQGRKGKGRPYIPSHYNDYHLYAPIFEALHRFGRSPAAVVEVLNHAAFAYPVCPAALETLQPAADVAAAVQPLVSEFPLSEVEIQAQEETARTLLEQYGERMEIVRTRTLMQIPVEHVPYTITAVQSFAEALRSTYNLKYADAPSVWSMRELYRASADRLHRFASALGPRPTVALALPSPDTAVPAADSAKATVADLFGSDDEGDSVPVAAAAKPAATVATRPRRAHYHNRKELDVFAVPELQQHELITRYNDIDSYGRVYASKKAPTQHLYTQAMKALKMLTHEQDVPPPHDPLRATEEGLKEDSERIVAAYNKRLRQRKDKEEKSMMLLSDARMIAATEARRDKLAQSMVEEYSVPASHIKELAKRTLRDEIENITPEEREKLNQAILDRNALTREVFSTRAQTYDQFWQDNLAIAHSLFKEPPPHTTTSAFGLVSVSFHNVAAGIFPSTRILPPKLPAVPSAAYSVPHVLSAASGNWRVCCRPTSVMSVIEQALHPRLTSNTPTFVAVMQSPLGRSLFASTPIGHPLPSGTVPTTGNIKVDMNAVIPAYHPHLPTACHELWSSVETLLPFLPEAAVAIPPSADNALVIRSLPRCHSGLSADRIASFTAQLFAAVTRVTTLGDVRPYRSFNLATARHTITDQHLLEMPSQFSKVMRKVLLGKIGARNLDELYLAATPYIKFGDNPTLMKELHAARRTQRDQQLQLISFLTTLTSDTPLAVHYGDTKNIFATFSQSYSHYVSALAGPEVLQAFIVTILRDGDTKIASELLKVLQRNGVAPNKTVMKALVRAAGLRSDEDLLWNALHSWMGSAGSVKGYHTKPDNIAYPGTQLRDYLSAQYTTDTPIRDHDAIAVVPRRLARYMAVQHAHARPRDLAFAYTHVTSKLMSEHIDWCKRQVAIANGKTCTPENLRDITLSFEKDPKVDRVGVDPAIYLPLKATQSRELSFDALHAMYEITAGNVSPEVVKPLPLDFAQSHRLTPSIITADMWIDIIDAAILCPTGNPRWYDPTQLSYQFVSQPELLPSDLTALTKVTYILAAAEYQLSLRYRKLMNTFKLDNPVSWEFPGEGATNFVAKEPVSVSMARDEGIVEGLAEQQLVRERVGDATIHNTDDLAMDSRVNNSQKIGYLTMPPAYTQTQVLAIPNKVWSHLFKRLAQRRFDNQLTAVSSFVFATAHHNSACHSLLSASPHANGAQWFNKLQAERAREAAQAGGSIVTSLGLANNLSGGRPYSTSTANKSTGAPAPAVARKASGLSSSLARPRVISSIAAGMRSMSSSAPHKSADLKLFSNQMGMGKQGSQKHSPKSPEAQSPARRSQFSASANYMDPSLSEIMTENLDRPVHLPAHQKVEEEILGMPESPFIPNFQDPHTWVTLARTTEDPSFAPEPRSAEDLIRGVDMSSETDILNFLFDRPTEAPAPVQNAQYMRDKHRLAAVMFDSNAVGNSVLSKDRTDWTSASEEDMAESGIDANMSQIFALLRKRVDPALLLTQLAELKANYDDFVNKYSLYTQQLQDNGMEPTEEDKQRFEAYVASYTHYVSFFRRLSKFMPVLKQTPLLRESLCDPERSVRSYESSIFFPAPRGKTRLPVYMPTLTSSPLTPNSPSQARVRRVPTMSRDTLRKFGLYQKMFDRTFTRTTTYAESVQYSYPVTVPQNIPRSTFVVPRYGVSPLSRTYGRPPMASYTHTLDATRLPTIFPLAQCPITSEAPHAYSVIDQNWRSLSQEYVRAYVRNRVGNLYGPQMATLVQHQHYKTRADMLLPALKNVHFSFQILPLLRLIGVHAAHGGYLRETALSSHIIRTVESIFEAEMDDMRLDYKLFYERISPICKHIVYIPDNLRPVLLNVLDKYSVSEDFLVAASRGFQIEDVKYVSHIMDKKPFLKDLIPFTIIGALRVLKFGEMGAAHDSVRNTLRRRTDALV